MKLMAGKVKVSSGCRLRGKRRGGRSACIGRSVESLICDIVFLHNVPYKDNCDIF